MYDNLEIKREIVRAKKTRKSIYIIIIKRLSLADKIYGTIYIYIYKLLNF